jgi:hypothetical protein
LAGSHRAPRRGTSSTQRPRASSVPRWAVAVAAVLALVPATYLTAQRVFDDSPASPGESSTDVPIPPVTPSATRTPTTGPSATPTQTTKPSPNLPRVTPDAPRRITSGDVLDAGFDSSVTELDASSATEVARLESRGSPASPGTDTVIVIGRVYADGDSAFGELSKLERGSKVSIRTDSGTMTYTVSSTALSAESGLASAPVIRTHQAGRLVLVGIRYDASGDRLGKALVVSAQLSGARKA